MTDRELALQTLENLEPAIARKALAYRRWFLDGSYCDAKTGRL